MKAVRAGAAVVVMLVACTRNNRPTEIAGFSLELPVGKETSAGDHENGSRTIELKRGAPATVVISWRPGTQPPRAELDDVGRALADQLGHGATYRIAPHEGRETVEVDAEATGSYALATFVPCGHRIVKLQATAARSTATELQNRMLRSFACHSS